jgi:hypothetical protein
MQINNIRVNIFTLKRIPLCHGEDRENKEIEEIWRLSN